jgi:hypothetical protein
MIECVVDKGFMHVLFLHTLHKIDYLCNSHEVLGDTFFNP